MAVLELSVPATAQAGSRAVIIVLSCQTLPPNLFILCTAALPRCILLQLVHAHTPALMWNQFPAWGSDASAPLSSVRPRDQMSSPSSNREHAAQ